MTILFVLSNVIDSMPFWPEQPEYFVPVCKQIQKYLTFHLGSNFILFRIIPAISANFSRNANFNQYKILTEKKKKNNKKFIPPPSGFRAFLPFLLLNFGLFFFFFFFWFQSATWLPLLLYLCVLAVLHLCLDFRAFRL